jgi:hypothetical protein
MKLYTEEVLKNSMNSVKYYMEHYNASTIDSIIEKHIKALGPIELPSDEEIWEKIEDSTYSLEYDTGFAQGVKWVIEQIKQQCK